MDVFAFLYFVVIDLSFRGVLGVVFAFLYWAILDLSFCRVLGGVFGLFGVGYKWHEPCFTLCVTRGILSARVYIHHLNGFIGSVEKAPLSIRSQRWHIGHHS